MATYNTEQEPNQNSIPGVEGDSNSQERNIEELHTSAKQKQIIDYRKKSLTLKKK